MAKNIVVELEDHADTLKDLKEQLEIDPATTAVVTIDMHRGHLDPKEATLPVSPEVSEAVRSAGKELLDFARGEGIPVVHVTVTWRPVEAYAFNPRLAAPKFVPGKDVGLTEAQRHGVMHNIEGSVQCELMPEIGPEPGDHWINNKKTYSIYLGTDLALLLRFLEIETVVLVGINTNTCVLNAAFETCNLGYKVVVIEEGCGSSYGQDLHLFALNAIARTCGWVLSLEEFKDKVRQSERAPTMA